MERNDYTVIVFKADKRTKKGERQILKQDHKDMDKATLDHLYRTTYGAGFRFEVHETYVKKINIMSGKEFTERFDTPYYCSPSSETYWSM